MTQCARCGEDLAPGSAYCPNCGLPVRRPLVADAPRTPTSAVTGALGTPPDGPPRARRPLLPVMALLAVIGVLAGAAYLYGSMTTSSDGTTASPRASTPPSTASSPVPSAGTTTASSPPHTCAFSPAATGNADVEDVGIPPTDVPADGIAVVTLTTNFGPIRLNLDRAAAPCAAASFVHLAEHHFFDRTTCHRETDSPGFQLLQCGDPSGTGSGGVAYGYPTETTGVIEYPRGTVAMANAGQGFDGSQFFMVWGDGYGVPPNYTVVGTVDAPGLAVLGTIASNGNTGSFGEGDGAPTRPVEIETTTVN